MIRALAALAIMTSGACKSERPRERKPERTREPAPAEAPPDADVVPPFAIDTGSSACSDWLTRAACVVRKADVPPDVREAFAGLADGLKARIADPAMRQETVDTCKQMLASTQEDFESMGCGDAESHAP